MRKLMFVVFIAFAFLLLHSNIATAYENEIRSLSNAMAENIAKAGKKRIAVVDFTDLQGNITELGRFIAEEMSVAIAGAGKGFEVIDRTHLKTILQEHKLVISGLIDSATAKKLGQIAGVEALITGTITPFGDSIRLSAKILDTATARVIGASSGGIPKTKAIEELLGRGIETTVPTTPGPRPATTPPPASKPAAKVEVNDFTFEARECKVSGQRVTCTISITNDDVRTKTILVEARNPGMSIMVDDLGNQYSPVGAWFGGKGGEGFNLPFQLEQAVPPRLPMNLSFKYEGLLPGARYASPVVDFQISGQGFFKAVLRNIPLSR